MSNRTELSCPVENRTLSPNETPPPFHDTSLIRRNHENAPRFGHTSEITGLSAFGGSDDSTEDYLKGLVAACLGIFCFFLVWTIALITLKCLGRKRVGFFSGDVHRERKPLPKAPQEQAHDAQEQAEGRKEFY